MEKTNIIVSKIINLVIKLFWIFVLGSVFGFFAEMLYGTIYTRAIVIRKGLIYGPFIQVYGMGALAYYILISKIKNPKEAFISRNDYGRNIGIYMLIFPRNIFWNCFMGL